jgi:ATP-dependent protease ClpP protease subunit
MKMPNWKEILDEINAAGSTHDVIRRKYLEKLHQVTGRNVIIYYSGWLQKPGLPGVEVNDNDKNGLMNTIYKMDISKGLDLILHTPGGDSAATESIVDYLHSVFGYNIRAFVPQLAMSAGTMIACACKEIIMGLHSSLGPVDPQIMGLPAHGVVEEFNRAIDEVKEDPSRIPIWQPIIAKYNPTFIGECEKAIAWSSEMVTAWLTEGMFSGQERPEERAGKAVKELTDHALTKSHARHLSYQKCKDIGLEVKLLEDTPDLQGAVLSVHHACIHTFSATGAYKIIENQSGQAFIQIIKQVVVQAQR